MTIGLWEILLLGVLAMLVFGGTRLSRLMGDLGEGFRQFRKAASVPETAPAASAEAAQPAGQATGAEVIPPGAPGPAPGPRVVDVTPGNTSIKV
jgi:TatA/E family protein of Tat protein translocase